jgi:hypothetical protein
MALLKFKRSAVPAKVPALNDLALGELAINTYDGKVYTKKDNGTASIVEVGGGGGVTSFNTRTGAVTLSGGDVTTALGFTPASTSGPTFSNGMTVNNGGNQVQIAFDGNLEIVRAAGGAYIDFKDSTAEDFDVRLQASGNQLNISAAGGLTFNGAGVLTGITSGQVTTALGYTPVNKAGDTMTGNLTVNNTVTAAILGSTAYNTPSLLRPIVGDDNWAFGGFQSGGDYWMQVQFYGVGDDNRGFRVLDKNGGTVRFRVNGAGDAYASNAFRAPIYYDSPNSAYYLDPAGTSNLSGVTLDGTLTGVTGRFAKNQTAGNYTTAALWTESYGNTTTGIAFHISGVVGKFLEMRTDQILYWSGIMNADGEFRAPIFRDMNNSAYFLDPSETSQLKTVEVSGGIGFRTFSNGSSSVNSQFYFANAANSRAWNWQLDENNDAALWNYQGSSWNKRFTFTAGSNFTAGGNIGANAGIFTNDGASRVLYLKGSGNIIQFQDADGTNRWENVGRNGTYYVYKGYGVGEGFKWQIDDNGNQIFNGIATFNTEIRTPIFRDSNDTSYYVDPNSVTRLNKLTAGERSLVGYATLSMAGLDVNTYYPVTIPVPVARQGTLRIENALNSNAPSWSTHPSGFSCYFEWTTNGLGWGTIGISRRVTDWREQFTNVQIVGGIDQMTFSSQEVIWLRGGGNYYLSADFDVSPTIRTTSYELYGQTVAPRSSIYNNPRDTAQGRVAFGSLQTNEQSLFRGNIDISTGSPQIVFTSTVSGRAASFGMTDAYNMYLNAASGGVLYLSEFRAPMFRDTDNSAYYLDPATGFNFLSSGVTYSGTGSGLFVANAEGTGNTVRLGAAWGRAGSYSNGGYTLGSEAWIAFWISGSEKGYIDSSSNLVMNGSVRAPVFYDVPDTAYYLDPAGTSNLNYVAVQQGNGINFNGAGNAFIKGTNVDNAVAGGSNLQIQSWFGIGFGPSIAGQPIPFGENAVWINARTGDLTARGNITAYSDIRVKKDVETINGALDLVSQMRGVRYTHIHTEWRGIGVIAQELEKVVPEVVQRDNDEHGALSVAYGNLVGVLIEAIKELSLKVKTLEEKDN